jgi:hypothetical protein
MFPKTALGNGEGPVRHIATNSFYWAQSQTERNGRKGDGLLEMTTESTDIVGGSACTIASAHDEQGDAEAARYRRHNYKRCTRAYPGQRGGSRMGERAWIKAIGKRLREDMGDCPTLPEEMLELLRKLDEVPSPVAHPTDRLAVSTTDPKARRG